MDSELKKNLQDKTTWTRGLYMLLFIFCYSIAKLVIFAVIILQFILTLFTRAPNPRLLKLGQGLSRYIFQILQFLTYTTEHHPYPLGAWPRAEAPSPSKPDSGDEATEVVNSEPTDKP
ncbi:MAG: DUF4389 domain-containing protein [Gammaproteobacteria bacterium]